jgi:hypothetical protein
MIPTYGYGDGPYVGSVACYGYASYVRFARFFTLTIQRVGWFTAAFSKVRKA